MKMIEWIIAMFKRKYPFDGSICGESDRYEFMPEFFMVIIFVSIFIFATCFVIFN